MSLILEDHTLFQESFEGEKEGESVGHLSVMANIKESTPLLARRISVNFHGYQLGKGDIRMAIHQAAVFIDDGVQYRSIHHKIDPLSLKLYSIYHSWPVQFFLNFVVFVILILPFFEYPSSMSLSSDYRYANVTPHLNQPNCGITESIEILCLLVFLCNWVMQLRLAGWKRFIRQPWLVLYSLMVVLSFFDLFVSFGFCVKVGQASLGSRLRLRRFFRPFFFLVPSSIMKKFVKAVVRTTIQISSVLVLLVIHIYVFAMIGMLIFPKPLPPTHSQLTNHTSNYTTDYYDDGYLGYSDNEELGEGLAMGGAIRNFSLQYGNFSNKEGTAYFSSVEDSLISLLVFLTTANNPDVMTKIYQYNRIAYLYFFFFLSIGLYLILNLLTAAVYSGFRGYIEQSMQSSFVRRCVAFRAAFAILSRETGGREVHKDLVRQLLQKAHLPKSQLPSMYTLLETVNIDSHSITWEEFKNVFNVISNRSNDKHEPEVEYYSQFRILALLQKFVRHNFFHYFTICMTLIHVLMLTIEMEVDYKNVVLHSNSPLACINFIFFFYYILEQVIKCLGLGRRIYFRYFSHIFEGVVTLAIVLTEIIILSWFGHPFHHARPEPENYATLIRVMNLFIVFRLLRIIPQFPSVNFVFGTMIEILKNLRAFAGIIIVIYYLFALFGMALFGENYKLENPNSTEIHRCGSYEQLEYYSYNFHDFASSLVILWNIMVVNNWSVFLDAFSRAATKWAQLYFVLWWLVAVIIIVNLFISLVIEVFLTRWELFHEARKQKREETNYRSNSTSADGTPLILESYTSSFTGSDIRMILRRNLIEPSESELQHEIHRHRDLI